jgi:hypothetical protein
MHKMHVKTKNDLIEVIFQLLDENDAIEWENETAYQYLQSLAAWLDNNDNVEPTWHLFAEALEAARNR